jgi:hypothetical protein
MLTEYPTITVKSAETITRENLLAALRQTRLRGFDRARPYENAKLTIETLDTDHLTPAQNYVMESSVAVADVLRRELIQLGYDMFAFDGGLIITTAEAPNEAIPVIPPIVEESDEPGGRQVLLINDGMHRIFAARRANLPISVVVARDMPAQYPYYAFALESGWSEVELLDQMPEGRIRKKYRIPDDYRALYRDFNAVFPGVQKDRWTPPAPASI